MRTVILDLDGTLMDTGADLLAAANAAVGADVLDPAEDKATAFRGGRAMIRLALGRMNGAWTEAEVDALFQPLLDRYEARIDERTTIYPGAMEAVDEMRGRGWRVGICTNKPEGLAETLLRRKGVRDRFDSLVGADRLAVRKPHPDHYALSVGEAGGDVARSLLVGDTETDRETARQAGVPCVLVAFGPEGRAVERMAPEALLNGYEDLVAIAERLIP
ncbi:phosphoglycolate phosphatase [Hasllibacter halocynthiae]|uniref:phosphoglycolate phosphatase n=1 Tax=Hasllibacter halocynthiae TaxID=595589 RepID=A0A2T0X7V9_9RHOB|nr:HAD-IA family hydrolase [Hasllibacter halocynthiae]PRY95019.1 phosphoglycolate phosphatase [Hasllibacter halocynthiae]